MINDKELIYGEIYSINALTATMDMSKTPVRDAIQKLVDEKLIDILPSRGIRLHQITKEELMQHSPMGFYNHPEMHLTDNKLSRKDVYECHQKILNAICEGDSAGAYEALLEHSDLMLKAF